MLKPCVFRGDGRQKIWQHRYLRDQRRRPPAKGFLSATLEDWQRAIELNFLSTVYFAREVIPHMQRKRWGRIITITSITTKQPVADLVLSNAVRAAVVGLVKSLANEFGKDGILVNNVGPGFTATDRLKELAKARSALPAKLSRNSLMAGPPMRRSSALASRAKWPKPSSGLPPSAHPISPAKPSLSMAACIKACD